MEHKCEKFWVCRDKYTPRWLNLFYVEPEWNCDAKAWLSDGSIVLCARVFQAVTGIALPPHPELIEARITETEIIGEPWIPA